MEESNSVYERIDELKKTITILEWDIHQIINNSLKALKEDKLRQCKRVLQELLEKSQEGIV